MNILATGRKKRKGKSTPLGVLIQKHTGPVFFTVRPDGKSRIKNENYVKLLNRHGKHFHKWHVPHYVVNQHDAGELKLKVSATLHNESGLTLLYLDVDCHDGVGNPEHARQLLAEFARRHFPNMPEPVVSDRGASAWLIVKTRTEYRTGYFLRATENDYNNMVERVQSYLQSLAAHLELNLSGVEVKGKVYAPKLIGGCVVSVKAGDMMKVPPREDWFEQQPVMWNHFLSEEFDVLLPENTHTHTLLDTTTEEVESYTAKSFTPEMVTQRHLDRLPALCQWIERELPDRPLKANKFGLNTRQFAELLMAIYLLKTNPDGTNPVARFEAFVGVLYQKGVFQFAYNHHRFVAVRDYLSAKGCILWRDNSYDFGTKKACKWRLLLEVENKLDALFSAETQHTHTLLDTDLVIDWTACNGDDLRPVLKPQIINLSVLYETVDRIVGSWTPDNLVTLAA